MEGTITVGVVLVGGLAVIVLFVVSRLTGIRFGYRIPRVEGWGAGYESVDSALDGAERAIDGYTEVE